MAIRPCAMRATAEASSVADVGTRSTVAKAVRAAASNCDTNSCLAGDDTELIWYPS
jgi:hypothetical protein